MKVDEAPNAEKDIYSNAKECVEECSKHNPPSLPFGYKCMKNSLGPNLGYCMKVDEAPNAEKDIYSNAESCVDECSKKGGYKCFHDDKGNHQCIKISDMPDELMGIFSTQEECVNSCNKNN